MFVVVFSIISNPVKNDNKLYNWNISNNFLLFQCHCVLLFFHSPIKKLYYQVIPNVKPMNTGDGSLCSFQNIPLPSAFLLYHTNHFLSIKNSAPTRISKNLRGGEISPQETDSTKSRYTKANISVTCAEQAIIVVNNTALEDSSNL